MSRGRPRATDACPTSPRPSSWRMSAAAVEYELRLAVLRRHAHESRVVSADLESAVRRGAFVDQRERLADAASDLRASGRAPLTCRCEGSNAFPAANR